MRLVIAQRAKQTGGRLRNPDRVTRHSGAVGLRAFDGGLVFNLRNGLVVSALVLLRPG